MSWSAVITLIGHVLTLAVGDGHQAREGRGLGVDLGQHLVGGHHEEVARVHEARRPQLACDGGGRGRVQADTLEALIVQR